MAFLGVLAVVVGVAVPAALIGLHAAEWLASEILGNVWGR